jgi:hypothetical protein
MIDYEQSSKKKLDRFLRQVGYHDTVAKTHSQPGALSMNSIPHICKNANKSPPPTFLLQMTKQQKEKEGYLQV